jgi:hypothetical protein
MVRLPPKFVWANTPTTYWPGTTREDVPIPPFQPKLIVRARTYAAFGHRSFPGALDRVEDMSRGYVQSSNVVPACVVGFADQRIEGTHLLIAGLRERVAHDGVDRRADAQGVGQDDGRLNGPKLPHLRRAGKLPKGVADEHRARNLLLEEIASMRKDRGDPGSHIIAFDQGCVTDAHAGNVGNRVEWSRWIHASHDAQLTSPGTQLGRKDDRGTDRAGGDQHGQADKTCAHERPDQANSTMSGGTGLKLVNSNH